MVWGILWDGVTDSGRVGDNRSISPVTVLDLCDSGLLAAVDVAWERFALKKDHVEVVAGVGITGSNGLGPYRPKAVREP
jgi:hypothetical protein